MPPSLRIALEAHRADLLRGLLTPLTEDGPDRRAPWAGGTLDQALAYQMISVIVTRLFANWVTWVAGRRIRSGDVVLDVRDVTPEKLAELTGADYVVVGKIPHHAYTTQIRPGDIFGAWPPQPAQGEDLELVYEDSQLQILRVGDSYRPRLFRPLPVNHQRQ